MFTVSGIEIGARAANAVDAKAVAIAEGQAKAFSELIGRVVSPADAAAVPSPDAETLQSVIAGYSLDNERTSAEEYLADLTVRFNPDAVEFVLSRSNIRLAVEQAPTALIVPVLWQDGSAVAWDPSSPWRAVWERLDLDNRLVPALLPLGDAADALADEQGLATADPGPLQLLAGRYGVETALVAVVAYDLAQGRIEGALAGFGPRGQIDLRQSGEIAEGEQAEAMQSIAAALLDSLDAYWRDAQTNDPARAAGQSVALGVPFRSLQEWVAVRSRLEAAAGVEQVEVRSLSAGEAQIVVTFTGDVQSFADGLALQGLYLRDDGTRWIVQAN